MTTIKELKYLILAFGLVGLALLGYFATQNAKEQAGEDQAGADTLAVDTVPEPVYFAGISLDTYDTIHVKIGRGQLLNQVLEPFNLDYSVIDQLANLPDSVFNERRIATRDMLIAYRKKGDPEMRVVGMVYSKDKTKYSRIVFGSTLRYEVDKFPVTLVEKVIAGTIKTSLYETIVKLGGSPDLVVALEEVYAWSLDFFRIRKGDFFKVAYMEKWINGENRGVHEIKASLFHHQGEHIYAFGFNQGEGITYFDQNGESLQKAFLKAPLKYRRISSRFSYSRFHPVLKVRRPHLGVDYAAPKGTPVLAVGDGEVTRYGYGRGNGNYVKIKHNGSYETMYLHLSRFGKGIRKGTRVRQGQIIGYVGSTGYSTGPHLDYRIFRNGVPVDPLKIKLPPSEPVKADLYHQFDSIRGFWSEKLQAVLVES